TTKEEFKFRPHEVPDFIPFAATYGTLVGHNISTFDLPTLERLQGLRKPLNALDTLVLAKLMFPDIPKGNSLGAWGD
ncbi:hypothetical protein, partial [Bacillus cereus]|uniref:hypothetical protein n=1 Tax=Bacillus cereus TaxID=1396 RepID=UPI0034D4FA0F